MGRLSSDGKGHDIVTPELECQEGNPHDWTSLGNAKYRCSVCAWFGFKRQIIQHMRSMQTDSQGITPRRCRKTVQGQSCKKPAVGHDSSNHGRTKSWRCGEHRL